MGTETTAGGRPLVDIRSPFTPTASGDLASVEGVASLRQSLRHLAAAAPGDLTHRPAWGSGLPDDRNEPVDEALLARSRGRVRAALERDPRVEEVLRVDAKVSLDGVVEVSFWVRAAGRTLTVDGIRTGIRA